MPHKLTWTKLLSPERAPRPQSTDSTVERPYATNDERTHFEQDYDRIVFSPPFRRLARKTQVHPMASNDHIHNRLTHSIEVASVGRSFAVRVADIAAERSDLRPGDIPALAWILQSAGLIHDLGNPPFGHAGEEVIREWAHEHQGLLFPPERFHSEDELDACQSDWRLFEGNAQGFRLASRPDNPMAGYLRLTYATLSTAVKYPWSSADSRAKQKHKHNCYSTERDIFQQMSTKLGLIVANNQWCRHPLSFLMEAADDICYRIIDPEDAVEMGICSPETVHDLFLRISRNPSNSWMSLSQLRGQAIRSLMDQCWDVFEKNFDAIMNGLRTDDLKSSLDSECQGQLEEVNAIYGSIFGHRKKIATELGAYHVLGRILKALVKTIQSISDAESYSEVHFLSKRTIELTWGQKHVEGNLHQSYRWWLSQVMDYVSGMTDDYATRLSREIGGFSVDVG
ncbi:MAG: dNTP triphosphohydrolase [Planctomycetota bacterium]